MRILAIDPGPTQSGWCVFDGQPVEAGIEENSSILFNIPLWESNHDALIIAVGNSAIDSIRWSRRFEKRWGSREVHYRHRFTVKAHICGEPRAKKANVRRGLLGRWPRGNKKNPGLTYGYKRDMWAALALAVTWWETGR